MRRKDKNILLVEDQETIAVIQKMELEDRNYEVIHASTGEKALEMLDQQEKIDLILMDIDLGPGLNGIETTRKIHSLYDIPVVFLSGHTEPHVVEETEQVTSYGYVVKNTGITVLDASIKMAFKLHQARKNDHQALVKAEDDLKLSENKINDLINNMLAGFVIVEPILDKDNNVVDIRFEAANEATHTITGIPVSKFIGKTSTELFGEIEKSYFNYHKQVLESGTAVQFTESFPALNKHFDLSIYKFDQNRLAVFYRDATDRLESRKALEASEQKYRDLFNHMGQEVHFWEVIRDEDGQIMNWKLIDANPAALKAWGKEAEDVLGKKTDEIFVDSNPIVAFKPIVEQIFRDQKPYSWKQYFEGNKQNMLMTSVPFGEYFVTTGIDIKLLDQEA